MRFKSRLTALVLACAALVAAACTLIAPTRAWADKSPVAKVTYYDEDKELKTLEDWDWGAIFNVARGNTKNGQVVIDFYTDWACEYEETVPVGADWVINLNGHMVNRGLATFDLQVYDNGRIFSVADSARLTINGGDKTVEHKGILRTDMNFWVSDEENGTDVIKGGLLTGGAIGEDAKGNGAGGGAISVWGSNAVVELVDVTLAGNVSYTLYGGHGGAICTQYAASHVELILTGAKVVYNIANTGAGIAHDADSGVLTLRQGSEVCYNRAKRDGGGISVDGLNFKKTWPTIRIYDSSVSHNVVQEYTGSSPEALGQGGGMYLLCYRVNIDLKNSEISENTAVYRGAGIFMSCAGPTLEMDNSKINGNVTSGTKASGAGVYMDSMNVKGEGSAASITMKNGSEISNNTLSADPKSYKGYGGGGIYAEGYLVTITLNTNSKINGNVSPTDGGGIYLGELVGDEGYKVNISSGSEISKNTAKGNPLDSNGHGGGICSTEEGTSIVLDGGSITENKSLNNGDGGGIYLGDKAYVTLKNGAHVNSNEAYYGGGIYLSTSADNSNLAISGASTVNGNVARYSGGGIYSSSEDSSISLFGSSEISSNQAKYNGGGICSTDDLSSITSDGTGKISLNKTTDTGNAKGNGGGIWFKEEITLNGLVITGNSARNSGGGIYCSNTSYRAFTLCGVMTITDNWAGESKESGTASNLLMRDKQNVCGGGSESNYLKAGSKIGVSFADLSGKRQISGNQAFIKNISDSYAEAVTSDNEDYKVTSDGKYLYLEKATRSTLTIFYGNGQSKKVQNVKEGAQVSLDTATYAKKSTYKGQEIAWRITSWEMYRWSGSTDTLVATAYPDEDGIATFTMPAYDVAVYSINKSPVCGLSLTLDDASEWESFSGDVAASRVVFTRADDSYYPVTGDEADKITEVTRTVADKKNGNGDVVAKEVTYQIGMDGEFFRKWNAYIDLAYLMDSSLEVTGEHLGTTTVTNCTVTTDDANNPILTATVTYPAQPLPNVTVYFDANEGSCDTASLTIDSGSTIGELPAATREGFSFDGWYDGDARVTGSTTFDKDTTVVAKWKANSYRIDVIMDGKIYACGSVEGGTVLARPDDPVKTGYHLENWYADVSLGTLFEFGKPVTGNIVLYAKMAKNSYTVKFETGEGGSAVADQPVFYGEKVVPVDMPTREGYIFDGWLLDGIAFSFDTAVTGNITLVAAWTPIYNTVSFVSDGATVATESVAYGEAVHAPAIDSKAGYDLDGWYTDPEFEHPFDFTTPVKSAFTLYAKWEAQTFTVHFTTGGGASTVEDQVVEYGKTAERPADPTRDGYTFAGWTLDGVAYSFDTPVTGDLDLVASWTEVEPEPDPEPDPDPDPDPDPEPDPEPEPEPEPEPDPEPEPEPTPDEDPDEGDDSEKEPEKEQEKASDKEPETLPGTGDPTLLYVGAIALAGSSTLVVAKRKRRA